MYSKKMQTHVIMALLAGLLFFILTPGIAVSIPQNGTHQVQAGVHAIVYAVVWGVLSMFLWKLLKTMNIAPSS